MPKKSDAHPLHHVRRHAHKVVTHRVSLVLLLLMTIPAVALGVFELYFTNRVLPGVYLESLQLSGVTRDDARAQLQQILEDRADAQIQFVQGDRELFVFDGTKQLFGYDVESSLNQAMEIGRTGNYLHQLYTRILAVRDGVRLQPVLAYDRDAVYRALDEKLKPYENKAKDASFALVNGAVTITGGTNGEEADKDELIAELGHFWSFTREDNRINVTLSPTPPSITAGDLQPLTSDVQTLATRKLIVVSQELYKEQFPIDGTDLFGLLSYERVDGRVQLRFDEYKVADRFRPLADKVRRDPVDAQFQFENDRATVFQPSLDGTALDTQKLSVDLLAAARDTQANANVEAPLKRTPPAITTASVNQYGIRDLVATGRSSFRGSSAGRIHNVALASQKLNGVLIAPNEVFSMYKVVGEIEAETGFKDAFVIKDGRTIPGVGGGVCQVSTTLFRSILDAGLPVLERRPHSYRVSYYEQDSSPGIDAAVYFPSWDLKFKNDTGNYLLLETKVDTKKLTAEFNLYGVDDGRTVTMTKPVVSGQTPPPPDLYVDDPNLQRGKTVQDEHAAWGATVTFNRTVMKNGETLLQDTFKSGYKPWQAVFRVGTKDN